MTDVRQLSQIKYAKATVLNNATKELLYLDYNQNTYILEDECIKWAAMKIWIADNLSNSMGSPYKKIFNYLHKALQRKQFDPVTLSKSVTLGDYTILITKWKGALL